jgi:hypothetical protein
MRPPSRPWAVSVKPDDELGFTSAHLFFLRGRLASPLPVSYREHRAIPPGLER